VGIRTVNAVMADAGPLIHLNEIGCLSILRIFEAIHIPDAVWLETVGQHRVLQDDILTLEIAYQHSLPKIEIMQFIHDKGLESLQDGECECLYLCEKMGISVLLTDDLAVREKAKQLNITPVGSLGIIVRAYKKGYISLSNAKLYITDLYYVSSLFVTRTIMELAIEQLQKGTEK